MQMQKWILVAVGCALLSACVSDSPVVRGNGSDRAIGWLHGNCIALEDARVRVGTRVAVVTLGETQQVVAARVTGRALDTDACPALLDDRKDVNSGSGLAFYQVDADPEVELGIGVAQMGGDHELSVAELLDTNGDGQRDSFSRCATAEGVRFSVWADETQHGAPLWTGYYYLGYDTEADCPEDG
ncbi:hypothetical protein [Lysobacter sp. F6437]|uniref:hypothetical protein n=1 Tax=Lysobacter sp. F6437 TaxID=3459296 RepID=UPI00403D91D0